MAFAFLCVLSGVLVDGARAAEAPEPPKVFSKGSSQPRTGRGVSEESRAVVEAAQFIYSAWEAFDRGESEEGKTAVRRAVALLEELEKKAGAGLQRDGRRAARLAVQVGRLQWELLGDAEEAKDAFARAALLDTENKLAARLLTEALARETARPGLPRE